MKFNFKKLSNSPLGAVIKVVLVILGGEFFIMIAIEGVFTPFFGKTVSPLFWDFLDPILLSIIVAPALHYLVLRPMKEQQTKLEQQKDDLGIAAVTFNAQDGVIVTDTKHTILKVNQSFTSITGYTSEEVIGKTPAILQSGRQDKEFYRRMRNSLEQNKFWQGEIWNRRKNGEIYPEWLTITAVTGETGNIHYVGIFSDITKRKAYEDKISFLAYHDKLTELPSRELFYDSLSQAMSQVRRKQDHLALFFLDLDGFKDVNDTYGHEAGDEVLKATSKRLLSCVREEDTVARLGGDEFAIIVGGIANSMDATIVAEKIVQNLSVPIALQNGHESRVGVSVGIAIYPENGSEIDMLLSAADSAMYESKARGKNTYTLSRVQAHWDLDNHSWIALDKTHFIGVPEIDHGHLDLVNVLNDLNMAVMSNKPANITDQLLVKLTSHIQTHFQQEERLMDEYGFFESDTCRNNDHKKEHQRLLEELGFLKDKFDHGGEMAVLHSLKGWLLSHISNMDRQLGDFISQNRKR